MRQQFILSSQAQDILRAQGLQERISNSAKEIETRCYMSRNALTQLLREIRDAYLIPAPGAFGTIFRSRLQNILLGTANHVWTMERANTQTTHSLKDDELPVISGLYASHVVEPEEFWPEGHQGLQSYSDLIGTIGAAFVEQNHRPDPREYAWESTQDGKSVRTSVSATIHGDLRVERTDVTPYPTIDPYDQPVSYRPIVDDDHEAIAAYHSTEPTLLAVLLKYAEQMELKLDFLEDDARQFLREMRRSDQSLGNFADAGSNMMGAYSVLMEFAFPLTDPCDPRSRRMPWAMSREFGPPYAFGTDGAGNLCCFLTDGTGKVLHTPVFTLPPQDVEQLINGLFHQASRGLGRTSVAELCRIVEYRFSEEFRAKNGIFTEQIQGQK